MSWIPPLCMWLSGGFAGAGICHSFEGTRSAKTIARSSYIASVLIGGLAFILGIEWN